MPMKACLDCGKRFRFAAGDEWKTLCMPCWRKSRGIGQDHAKDLTIIRLTLELNAARDELARRVTRTDSSALLEPGNLKALRRLCHPDKHGGSESATRLSQLVNHELSRRG